MWLGKKAAEKVRAREDGASAAEVSVGGESPAVVTDGERRRSRLFSPGGYCWRPGSGDTVLVVGGGEPCVAGREQKCPVALEAGEVYLYSGGASLHLKNSGEIVVRGKLVAEDGAEIAGGAKIAGGAEIEGGAAIAGGAEIEGGLTVDGQSVTGGNG